MFTLEEVRAAFPEIAFPSDVEVQARVEHNANEAVRLENEKRAEREQVERELQSLRDQLAAKESKLAELSAQG